MSGSKRPDYDSATQWLQRLDDPEVREAEIQGWLEWFGRSGENRKAFEEMQALRRRLRALPEDMRQQLAESARLDRADPHERKGIRRFNWRSSTRLALAATVGAVSVALGTWWHGRVDSTHTVYAASLDLPRTVTLPDGSALILAPDAAVSVSYSKQFRDIALERGEAFFEVGRDPKRPFVVTAGHVRVQALGTAFNVNRREGGVTVMVAEGSVEVLDGTSKERRRMSGGQRKRIEERASQADVPSRMAPRPGEAGMEFIDAPLAEAIAFVNSHGGVRLDIGDPRVAELTYSGTILASHIDEWVGSLQRVYPIRSIALEDGSRTLILRSREAR